MWFYELIVTSQHITFLSIFRCSVTCLTQAYKALENSLSYMQSRQWAKCTLAKKAAITLKILRVNEIVGYD